MAPWHWYWKLEGDESYGEERRTRDEIVAAANREVPAGERFEIIEARMSDAKMHEGSDYIPFLRSRNHTDWIEWKGGSNPVPGQSVDVRFRDGDESFGDPSRDWCWDHG